MREILFRGKRKDNGEWVEAFSVMKSMIDDEWIHYIGASKDAYMELDTNFNLFSAKSMDDFLFYSVHPETIGQFIGLTDKNGKKVFEGDIVHVLGNQQVEDWKNVNYIGSVAFLDAGFCVIDGTIEDHAFRRYQLPRLDFDLEVVGNIHDNPELLEGI